VGGKSVGRHYTVMLVAASGSLRDRRPSLGLCLNPFTRFSIPHTIRILCYTHYIRVFTGSFAPPISCVQYSGFDLARILLHSAVWRWSTSPPLLTSIQCRSWAHSPFSPGWSILLGLFCAMWSLVGRFDSRLADTRPSFSRSFIIWWWTFFSVLGDSSSY